MGYKKDSPKIKKFRIFSPSPAPGANLVHEKPLALIPPSGHANTVRIFPGGCRLCLRPPPRYALFLRRVTPTQSHFSRTPPLFAPPSPLRLISSSGHANAVPLFPGRCRLCWRLPPRYALFLRRATPTRAEFSRADAAFVGVPLPATPYFFALPRQRGPTFPGRTSPLFASPSPLRLIPPPRHANTVWIFPGEHRLRWRPPPRCALFLRLATPTRSGFSRADATFVGVPLPAAPYSFASPRQHRPDFPDMLAYLDTRKLKKRDSLQ